MNDYWIPIVLAAALFGSNTFLTHAVGRSALYSAQQKALQIGLVWLLPVFGSMLVGGVLWSNRDRVFARRHAADLESGAIGGSGDPISHEQ